MRKFILPILLLHFAVAVNAATYYFCVSSGDDSRSSSQAQNSATPWKTINKLNSIMSILRPGDQVLFKRGETFSGAFTVTVSGSGSQPITFGAYGSGNKPVISGFANLSGWTQVRSNVWEADFSPAAGKTNMVVMKNKVQKIGRYPNFNTKNKGYLTIDSHSGSTQLTSSQLSSSPNWAGGEVVIRKTRWVIDRSRINYHSGNTMGFDAASIYNLTDKYGFFIQNHTNTLDQNGEWYYDNNRRKLQMYFNNNPGSQKVKGSVIETLVTISFQNYIKFDNLQFTGANSYVFNLTNSNNITVNACAINFTGNTAVLGLSSYNFTLSNSSINNTNNNAISLYWNCSNASITNNVIKNTALIPGMGQNSTGTNQGINILGNNNLIQYNEVDSSGANGIHFEGDYSTVQYNFVNTFGLTVDDCGGIYTGQGLGDNTQHNSKSILNNIVLNGIGAVEGTDDYTYVPANGIYLDDNSNHITVMNNTVANCAHAGIFNHNSTYTNITNNTIYNNNKEQFLGVRSFNPVSNVTLTGNIMFSKTVTQFVNKIESYYGSNNLSQFGNFNNNYYCRPIDNSYIFYDVYTSGGRYYTSYETLDTWRSKFGFDGNSKGAPGTIPSFTYSSSKGVNIYPNGGYHQDINYVSKYSTINDVSTVWNPNKLDAGTLQVTANNYSSSNNFYLTLPTNNTVQAGKTYLLTFSLQGGANGRPMTVYLRQQDYPNSDLTSRTMIPIPNNRNDFQFGFTANSTSRVSIELDVAEPNSATWIDNVMLQEATVKQTNPNDYIVFQYNAGTSAKSFTLNNGTYYDAKGATYSGKVTLQPYTSLVLFKKTSQSQFKVSSDESLQAINLQGNLTDASVNASSMSSSNLNWQVDNQNEDASVYEIERSSDGVNFLSVGNASAKKAGDETVNYQFTDGKPNSGKNYYRIRQQDEKGTLAFSKVVLINNISFRLNPNPARDVVHLMFDQPIKEADHLDKNIIIRNANGVVVKTILFPLSQNLNQVDIDVSSLQQGMYILSITSEEKSFSRKFLKQ